MSNSQQVPSTQHSCARTTVSALVPDFWHLRLLVLASARAQGPAHKLAA
jgi:hypothetical protein